MASFAFPIHNTLYSLTINNFLYIEDFHTKYKNNQLVNKSYQHFFTLRDMNWLTINKTWLEKETAFSIKVEKKHVKLFEQLHQLKIWFNKNKSSYWFLGNLSPVVFPELYKNLHKTKTIAEKTFQQIFEKILSSQYQTFLANDQQLLWQLTGVNPSGKYRFKQYSSFYSQGEVWANASKPLPSNAFLEIQIAYDKTIKDFYLKPSLCKLSFKNNKGEKKYFFELSDILAWGVLQQWVTLAELITLNNTLQAKKFFILEKMETITRTEPEVSSLFAKFNFQKVSILKPSYISNLIDQDFLEIKIDYRQKASGIQAMLFYNINIANLTKNDQSLINQLVKKKDILVFVIDKTKFKKLFLPLVLLFAQLSDNHYQDMKSIVETLLSLVVKPSLSKNSKQEKQ